MLYDFIVLFDKLSVSWDNSASDAGFVKYAERSNASKAWQWIMMDRMTCSNMLRLL